MLRLEVQIDEFMQFWKTLSASEREDILNAHCRSNKRLGQHSLSDYLSAFRDYVDECSYDAREATDDYLRDLTTDMSSALYEFDRLH